MAAQRRECVWCLGNMNFRVTRHSVRQRQEWGRHGVGSAEEHKFYPFREQQGPPRPRREGSPGILVEKRARAGGGMGWVAGRPAGGQSCLRG